MAKLGLQLYTVKDELEKDYLGTIRKVGKMGYDGVEFPGGVMEAASAEDIKRTADDAGLEIAGAVFMLDELENKYDEILQYCRKINCPVIVFPWILEEDRTKVGYLKIAQRLNAMGKRLKNENIKLLYHIHGYEFENFDGKTGIDIMIEESNPEYFNLEIDVYWVEWARVNSVEFMKKYGSRSPSIHFKDMKDKKEMQDVEVGDGIIDMSNLVREGIKYNVDWFIVEQEAFDRPTLESADISLKNLKRIVTQIDISQ